MSPRSYKQFCGLARGLDVIGGRWTLLIVRELLLGPRRYTDMLGGLPGITTNLLADRLKQMTEHGLIEKTRTPPPTPATVYQLTESGRELEPVVMAIGRWGGRFMMRPPEGDTVNIAWGLVSMKRRYVGQPDLTMELDIDGRRFQIRAEDGHVNVREDCPWDPPTVAHGALTAFQTLFFRGGSASALEEAGQLTITGQREVWETYLAAFGLNA